MMTKIKYALAFLWGAAYAASWFLMFTPTGGVAILWKPFPVMFVLFSTLAFIYFIICFFGDYWNKE